MRSLRNAQPDDGRLSMRLTEAQSPTAPLSATRRAVGPMKIPQTPM
jgi:hypothetical protein